jgi:hypothetical protein
MNDQTIKSKRKAKFKEGTSVEDSITHQVTEALASMLVELRRQQRYGEGRSIRAFALINFTGGKFVLDMRLLPDAEIAADELYQIVKRDS